ncbi:conserved hypothetical protein [Coccidioides posadasii str. Silveira]|uniref:Uncharacterized protein n=1 Tax=Coccidioides posadasii (strain RMSCC 757 / Silveira) TaxID=443226 RepID=E9DCS1_COCPS|nr:conserved hypothetical protein [Coccidioides posadasii str. Silveira]
MGLVWCLLVGKEEKKEGSAREGRKKEKPGMVQTGEKARKPKGVAGCGGKSQKLVPRVWANQNSPKVLTLVAYRHLRVYYAFSCDGFWRCPDSLGGTWSRTSTLSKLGRKDCERSISFWSLPEHGENSGILPQPTTEDTEQLSQDFLEEEVWSMYFILTLQIMQSASTTSQFTQYRNMYNPDRFSGVILTSHEILKSTKILRSKQANSQRRVSGYPYAGAAVNIIATKAREGEGAQGITKFHA